jgi:hypothetical protein
VNGWFPAPRTDLGDGLLRHPTAYVLLMYLRFRARIRPGVINHGGQKIELNKGQVVSGRHRIANDLALTSRQAEVALNFLKKYGLVKIVSNNRYSIYTVERPKVGAAVGVADRQDRCSKQEQSAL